MRTTTTAPVIPSVARDEVIPSVARDLLLPIIGLMLCAASTVAAQGRAGEPICVIDGAYRPPSECNITPQAGPPQDPLARFLFPPELVMANQQAIRLTDRQRASIQDAMREAQGRFVDLQFTMSGEMERLQRLLQGTSVDESRVLDQVDRVLAAEREVKRTQFSLMLQIKNTLTEEQQARLNQLRGRSPGVPGRPDDG